MKKGRLCLFIKFSAGELLKMVRGKKILRLLWQKFFNQKQEQINQYNRKESRREAKEEKKTAFKRDMRA